MSQMSQLLCFPIYLLYAYIEYQLQSYEIYQLKMQFYFNSNQMLNKQKPHSDNPTNRFKNNQKPNLKSSATNIDIPEPLHLSPLTPLSFSQQASLQFIPQKHDFCFQKPTCTKGCYKIIQQLHCKNIQSEKELHLIKQLYSQQKNKYLDLKNLYKEGEYLFSVLEDKKNNLQRQNKDLRNALDEVLERESKSSKGYNNSRHQNYGNNFNSNKQQNNIQNNYKSNANLNLNLNESQFQRQGQTSKQIRSAKIKIGKKQIPVIKVNVPQQTFQIKTNIPYQNKNQYQNNSNNYNSSNEHEHGTSSTQTLDKVKQLSEQIKKLSSRLIKVQQTNRQLQYCVQEKQKQLDRQASFTKRELQIVFNQNVKLQQQLRNVSNNTLNNNSAKTNKNTNINANTNLQTGTSQCLNQNLQSVSSSYYQSQNILQLKIKYEHSQQQLLKKDQMLKNLYQQCFKLQKQLDDFKIFQSLKSPKSSKSLNQNQKVQELQSKIVALTAYSKNLLSDCDQAVHLLRAQNKILQQKNADFEQKQKSYQDQLKRLYKVLQNKNIELGQIYSNLKQSQKRTDSLSSNKNNNSMMSHQPKSAIQNNNNNNEYYTFSNKKNLISSFSNSDMGNHQKFNLF